MNYMKNKEKKVIRLTVYFDGLCVLCSAEINHYKKQKGAEQIQFVDITASDFSAEAHGVDPFLVHKVMHVKNSRGDLITGVNAFVEIWKVLPRYGFAAKLAKNALVARGMNVGYWAFTKARPYLPRRKRADCSDSPYCELKAN